MRVFGLTTGADTAGTNVGIKRAFAKHAPDWRYDSMVASSNYIRYPVDVPWAQDTLEELYDAADVIQLHSRTDGHRFYDNGQCKPTVVMHHGMHDGMQHAYPTVVKEAAALGMAQVGSTLDLAIRDPSVTWLPPPVDIKRMRVLRKQHYRHRKTLRIGHAPTDRKIKGTAAFESAMRRLAERYPVEMVLIEKLPWTECLAIKATCDVFYDQPTLGYGSNAIESWAMGIPVIAGVADPKIREGMLDRWGELPFYEANEQTLYDALHHLVVEKDLRKEYADIGTSHVERWHAEHVTVAILERVYLTAQPTKPGGNEKRAATKNRLMQRRRPIPNWRLPA